MNEKVDIEIFGRKLTLDIEDITPIEINALAQKVTEMMYDVARKNNKIVDSSKLGILTALQFASLHEKAKESQDTQTRVIEHTVEELTIALQNALAAAGRK